VTIGTIAAVVDLVFPVVKLQWFRAGFQLDNLRTASSGTGKNLRTDQNGGEQTCLQHYFFHD
jgi:hypothetical protein